MEFSNQIIKIEYPIYLCRYSFPDGTSPHRLEKWDLRKRSVISSAEIGVFGILLDDRVNNDSVNYYDRKYYRQEENILILLESSKNYIVNNVSEDNIEKMFCKMTDTPFLNLQSMGLPSLGYYETSVSRANIIGTAQNGEFGKILKLAMSNNAAKGRDVFAGLGNIKDKFSPKHRIKTVDDEWKELTTKLLLGMWEI